MQKYVVDLSEAVLRHNRCLKPEDVASSKNNVGIGIMYCSCFNNMFIF